MARTPSRKSSLPAGSKAIRAISAVPPTSSWPRMARCWCPTIGPVRSTASATPRSKAFATGGCGCSGTSGRSFAFLERLPLNPTTVIPGCAAWRRPGIHTPDRGYGFRAREFVAPRNDETDGDLSLRCRHHDFHDMRRFEIDADAGPHRWILGVDPFVPGAVHLALPLHVSDVDDGREDLAFIRAAQREALVDPGERLCALLVHRGGDRIGRDRHGEHKVVVNDGAAAGWREARKATDHG